ncbi:MAG: serine hydrolase [Streptosporangiales bacterium]|nr:serine hydrolase [Streptosporangiales bacterium]
MPSRFRARLEAWLPALVEAGPGNVHLAAWDLAEREPLGVAADVAVPAASTIKVPIMAAALTEVVAGRLGLSDTIPLKETRTGGTGVLDALGHLDRLSLADLLTLMVMVSDNAATNLVIETVGIAAVNAFCERAGLTSTRLRRLLMDYEARARGLENTTSARDQATVLEGLANGTLLPPRLSAFAMEVLAAQQFNDRLPALLPDDAAVAHKTGELSGIRHDVGVLTTPQGRRAVVAVLVTGLAGEPHSPTGAAAACRMVAEIGFACYRALSP